MHGEEPEQLVDTKNTDEYKNAVKSEKNALSDNLKNAVKDMKNVSSIRQSGIISGYKAKYLEDKINNQANTPGDLSTLRSETVKAKNFPKNAQEMQDNLKEKYPKPVNGKSVVDIANNVYFPNDEVNARNKIREKFRKKNKK